MTSSNAVFRISKEFSKQFRKETDNICYILFVDQSNINELENILIKEFNYCISNYYLDMLNDDNKDSMSFELSPGKLIKIFKFNKLKMRIGYFRNTLAKVPNLLLENKLNSVDILIPEYKNFVKLVKNENDFLAEFHEGFLLGNYRFSKYKTENKECKSILVNYIYKDTDLLDRLFNKSENIIASVLLARDLSNEPSTELTPQLFVEKATEILSGLNIKLEIHDKNNLIDNRLNGIISVGQGSTNSPYLLVAKYKSDKSFAKNITIVGKGVTFDSGGLCLKPAASMPEMKADMAGAAVALAVLAAAAKLNLGHNISVYIPLVENMPSGSSYKPGDIIKMYSGNTVEIVDTDAEGRLIIADALSFAQNNQSDLIIDVATLTGSVVVALGPNYAGMFSNNDDFAKLIKNASEITDEKIWQLPLIEEYNSMLKSDIADMKNLGEKWGGSITAALFLQKFIKNNNNWIHLDVAGPSFPSKFAINAEKSMTGFGVRLLLKLIEDL